MVKKTIMRKSIFVLLFIFIIISNAYSQTVLEILDKYDPDGSFLVQYNISSKKEIESSPASYTSYKRYVSGTGFAMVENLPLAVHEMSHYYSMNSAYLIERAFLKEKGLQDSAGFHHYNIYLSNNETAFVRKTPVFSSEEIAGIVPTFMRDRRYQIYISRPRSIQSTKVDGVYGLIDEMNAYLIGSNTFFNLSDYYKEKNMPRYWMRYFSGFYSSFQGAYQFKYYILQYLLFAKENHKEIYQNVMNNNNFRYTYKKVTSNMDKLFFNFEERKKNIFKSVSKEDYNLNENDDKILLETNSGTYYTKTVKNNILQIRKELAKDKFKDIISELSADVSLENNILEKTVLPPKIIVEIENKNLVISFEESTTDSKIYYSLDKSDPRMKKGMLYEKKIIIPFPRSGRVDIKAYAEKDNMYPSIMEHIYYKVSIR